MPDPTQQQTLRALGDDGVRELVERYMDAMASGDVDAVVSMLAEDAAWSMPPLGTWYRGQQALRAFLEMGPLSGRFRWKHALASANAQPAIAAYTWHEDERCYRPFALDVLSAPRRRASRRSRRSSSAPPSPTAEGFEDYPNHPLDGWRIADYERFGLPARLD